LIERRIALEARRQLRFSNLSIKQIAAELGYDDPAYFTRFATRALGTPPSNYRAASRTLPPPQNMNAAVSSTLRRAEFDTLE
ncbi:MAG TPA: helix-turn-helix domain-containing protein, partial [Devosia sp.]